MNPIVLYGTESGNSEMAADELAERFSDRRAVDLSDVDASTLSAANAYLIVCSTYGEGELPATAQPFVDQLLDARPDLTGVRFALFSLGDSGYEASYGGGAAQLEGHLRTLGATRFGDVGQHDAAGPDDLVDAALAWAEAALAAAPVAATESEPAEASARDDSASDEPDLLPFRSPEFLENPYPYYAHLRETQPVYRHPTGFWAVTRYEDVSKLLYDRSMSVADIDYGPAASIHDTMLGSDAPKHTRIRRTHGRWFTPKLAQQWSGVMRGEIDRRLDEIVAAGGRFDAVHDLAFPSTYATICHIFGVPDEHGEAVRAATYDTILALGLGPSDRDNATAETAYVWFWNHIEQLLVEVRENPTGGLMNSLLQSEDEGLLTHDEVVASLFLLFAVGHLDISFLIVHGLQLLAERPELFATFRDEPAKRGDIINEILRWDTPEQFVARHTTAPIVVGDIEIPADEVLVLLLGAANRDPEVFADPDRFDIERSAELSKQLAFGAGIHGCVGQVLARAEAEEVFSAIVDRFSSIEVVDQVVRGNSDFIRSISSMTLQVS